jgi:hypothetical protein
VWIGQGTSLSCCSGTGVEDERREVRSVTTTPLSVFLNRPDGHLPATCWARPGRLACSGTKQPCWEGRSETFGEGHAPAQQRRWETGGARSRRVLLSGDSALGSTAITSGPRRDVGQCRRVRRPKGEHEAPWLPWPRSRLGSLQQRRQGRRGAGQGCEMGREGDGWGRWGVWMDGWMDWLHNSYCCG